MSEKRNKIGALWTRTTPGKPDYFKGTITIGEVTTEIVVFVNGFKESDRHPSHVIYQSQPRAAGEPEA